MLKFKSRCRLHRMMRTVEALEQRLLLSSTWTVTSTADDGSSGTLRYAVTHSAAGDKIQFDPTVFSPGSPVTINVTGTLDVNHNLTIQGPGQAVLTVSGNNTYTAFTIEPGVSASISGLTIASSSVSNSGAFVLSNCAISSGLGPIQSLSGSATITGCAFRDDTGGFITAQSGTLAVANCSFYGGGNSSVVRGGAITIGQGLTAVTISGSTFVNNIQPEGGAILSHSSMSIVNCSFYQNSAASSYGGAISIEQGNLSISDSTIYGNTSYKAGAGIYSAGGQITLANTIVAGNTWPGLNSFKYESDIVGPATGSYNLIGDGSGGLDAASHNLLGTQQVPLDPLLDTNNRDPYWGTSTGVLMPLPGSPALDSGSNALIPAGVVTDQRGLPRISNGSVDIGAYEEQYSTIVVNTPGDPTTASPGVTSLREAVAAVNADTTPDAPAIVFDPAVFPPGATSTITLSGSVLTLNANVNIEGPGAAALSIVGSITVNAGALISGLTFTGGGSVFNYQGLHLFLNGVAINGCNGGEAILNYTSITLNGCNISNNSSTTNPAGLLNQGTAVINNSTFSRNVSTSAPGAINNNGRLTITNSTFADNSGTDGGAIYQNGTYLLLSGDTFVDNQGTTYGGALYAAYDITLVNCTLDRNSAVLGGAIYTYGYVNVVLTNCTVANNTATLAATGTQEGGGIYIYNRSGSGVWLYNTIMAGNQPENLAGTVDSGFKSPAPTTPSSNNLISGVTAGAGGLVNGTNGNLIGANPLLAPLAFYGGPTQTMALMAGSAALNAGSNALAVDANGNPLRTDQRGLPRIFGSAVDIGAYEVQPPALMGDVNHDGTVNLSDLLSLTRNFGKTTPLYENGDLDGNGTVSLGDFLTLTRNFGKSAVVNPLLVTSTADDGSLGTLRCAITHSNAGDTITFDPTVFAPGTSHTLTLNGSQLELTHTLTIQGPGSANLSISGNNASRIFQIDPSITASISGLTLTSANAGTAYGGAINNAGTLNLANCSITSSTATDGGGLYSISGTANVTNCTFSNDTASAYGGALFNDAQATSTVTGCTLLSNSAGHGGALLDYGTALVLINDTITQNSSTGSGGGINNVAGNLMVSNCTIMNNTTGSSGGGIFNGQTATINNSIVAQNSTTAAAPSDLAGNSFAGSNNLIGDGSGGLSASNHNLLGTTSSLLNPKLGSLSSNGGPTLTFMPLSGSPVIDAGSNALIPTGISTDQRGYGRIFNSTVDMGAVEFGSSLAPTIRSGSQQPALTTVRRRV